ncbi:MAG: phenylalanine--tRNA ligase subunit beta [Sphingorhabdus sp.]
MKFSLSWLKAHLDTEASVQDVADCLNRIGLEVEGIENPADALRPFRIAKVVKAVKHPQAEKLQVLVVDAGDGPLQVVCGAPNAREGMTGIFGPAGAIVPSNGMELKVTAIRGEQSNGMMCSLAELGLGDDHDGIAELPDDAPKGASYADWAHLDDPVIEVSITPNRQDCMGVHGIARDLAAAGLGTLKALKAPAVAGSYPCPIDIRTDDVEACPAFYGRVIKGVTNGASPDWMQARLKAAGQRPISALVDITNYVMLDHGRPSHAYDLAKLTGPIVARRAKDGEQVMALNEKVYTLTSDMTVIADEAGVHDIAGIMGGQHSGCSETTTDVLLEIAYFTPERIAKTGQALTLTSDARSRFERGVDPGFMGYGLELVSELVLQICGGVASEIVKAGEPPLEPRQLDFNPAHTAALGGVEVDEEEQKAILVRLGFGVDPAWKVTIPTWRRDVEGSADLVEEIVRIHGIDKVPSTPLPRVEGVAKPTATPMQRQERKVRRVAAARGLNEAINWSFIPEKEAAAFGGGAWTLANPISEDMKVMRPSLLPGLLSAARRNLDRGASSVRLFEIGRRYLAEEERLTVGILLAGDKSQRGWASGKATKFDAYDAKAEVLALLAAAGVATDSLMVLSEAGAHYHPGQSATLRMGPKNVLAAFGTLHPATAKAFDLDGAVVAAEIYLDAIPAKKAPKEGNAFMRPAYIPPALQAVTRDFAFLVSEELPAGDLVRAIKGCDKDNIVAVRLFDRFAGQGVPEGQVSLAIEVKLQPGEKSYTDEELKAISDRVVAAAGKVGAALRT